MNKRAYIFCLVAAVIVATFVIGYNIGTDKQSKKNNSQTNAKVIEKEGYWLQSVEGYIVVFENDRATVVASTEIPVSSLSKKEQDVLAEGFYFDTAEELFKFIPMRMEQFYDKFDKEYMKVPIFKYYDVFQMFQRISCASNEDIVTIKEKLLDRAVKNGNIYKKNYQI